MTSCDQQNKSLYLEMKMTFVEPKFLEYSSQGVQFFDGQNK